jgi:hypothetical protein
VRAGKEIARYPGRTKTLRTAVGEEAKGFCEPSVQDNQRSGTVSPRLLLSTRLAPAPARVGAEGPAMAAGAGSRTHYCCERCRGAGRLC